MYRSKTYSSSCQQRKLRSIKEMPFPWKNYIGYLMWPLYHTQLQSAAIYNLSDRSLLAKSGSFPDQVPIDHINDIIEELENPGSLRLTREGKIRIGEQTFPMIQGEPGTVIRGKKEDESEGVTIYKTNEALLIGIYKSPMRSWQADMIVEWIGKYLIRNGH